MQAITEDNQALEYLVLSVLLKAGRDGLTVPEFAKRLPGYQAKRCLWDLVDNGRIEWRRDPVTKKVETRDRLVVYVLPSHVLESHAAHLEWKGSAMPTWFNTILDTVKAKAGPLWQYLFAHRSLVAGVMAVIIGLLRYYTKGAGSVLITSAEFACGMVVMHGIDDATK